jgi:hypothetical protein
MYGSWQACRGTLCYASVPALVSAAPCPQQLQCDICVHNLEGRTFTMLAIIMLPTVMRAGPTAYGGMEAAQTVCHCQFWQSQHIAAALIQPKAVHIGY